MQGGLAGVARRVRLQLPRYPQMAHGSGQYQLVNDEYFIGVPRLVGLARCCQLRDEPDLPSHRILGVLNEVEGKVQSALSVDHDVFVTSGGGAGKPRKLPRVRSTVRS